MAIPLMLASGAGGFVLMSAIGIQAPVALFSSIPLAKRRHQENAAFNLDRAYHRIARVSSLAVILVSLVTLLVMRFVPSPGTVCFLLGMILSFVCSLRRMSPNNRKNQQRFASAYEDCYDFFDDEDAQTQDLSRLMEELHSGRHAL